MSEGWSIVEPLWFALSLGGAFVVGAVLSAATPGRRDDVIPWVIGSSLSASLISCPVVALLWGAWVAVQVTASILIALLASLYICLALSPLFGLIAGRPNTHTAHHYTTEKATADARLQEQIRDLEELEDRARLYTSRDLRREAAICHKAGAHYIRKWRKARLKEFYAETNRWPDPEIVEDYSRRRFCELHEAYNRVGDILEPGVVDGDGHV